MKASLPKRITRDALIAGLLFLSPTAFAQQQVIPIWPGVAPESENWTQKEVEYLTPEKKKKVRNVVTPTLTVFLPNRSNANGTAMIVCPGGGFRYLTWQNEGTEVAQWLTSRGVAAFVLKYRVINTGATEEEFQKALAAMSASSSREVDKAGRPAGSANSATPSASGDTSSRDGDTMSILSLAVADGRQAMKVVRQHAAEWGIAPDRIGLMGFSAGGAVTMGVVLDHDADSRPSFAAPIYGGNVNGATIPADAPPLFILAANDDAAASISSAKLYSDWKAAGLPVELHIYSKGGHGFGMSKRDLPVDHWIDRLGDWLEGQGLLKQATR